MARVRYREGDWFAVPLRDGGYSGGLIARTNPGGVLLGYLFGPLRSEIPELEDVAGLRPGDAVLIGKFGHLGIVQGKWPLLGRVDGWGPAGAVDAGVRPLRGADRAVFPVFYDDDDPNRVLHEELVAPGEAEQAPKDGMMGAGFAEGALTRLLA
jgi:hypothetical protein